MLQVIQQTREEKIASYLKLTKRELAEMLTTANDAIAVLSGRPSDDAPWRRQGYHFHNRTNSTTPVTFAPAVWTIGTWN